MLARTLLVSAGCLRYGPLRAAMGKFDLNRIAAVAGIIGAIAAVIALWPIFFPHPEPVPPPTPPHALSETKWGICIAQNGCPWPSDPRFETRWIGCGNQDEEAKKLCSHDDGTGKIVVGKHTIPSAIGGPMKSGATWNGIQCNSSCGCALYTFTCSN